MPDTSVILQTRRRLFTPTSRFWRQLFFDIFPGVLTCLMAIMLGITMYISPHQPLRTWLFLAAYGLSGIWFLLRSIRRIRKERTGDRWRERFSNGLCQRCGFDLRSCTSVRCSECGTWHGKLPARQFASATGSD